MDIIKSFIYKHYPTLDESSIYICDDGITILFKTTDSNELHSCYYDLETESLKINY